MARDEATGNAGGRPQRDTLRRPKGTGWNGTFCATGAKTAGTDEAHGGRESGWGGRRAGKWLERAVLRGEMAGVGRFAAPLGWNGTKCIAFRMESRVM